MKILFIHRTFPAQFENLIKALAKENHEIVFITNNPNSPNLEGVKKFIALENSKQTKDSNPYIDEFEEAIRLGQATAKKAIELKSEGFIPDVIYGFSGWGSMMFIKDVFPKTPLLCYLEWYGTCENSVFDFEGKILDEKTKENIRCNNTYILQNIAASNALLTPTEWQKSLFPEIIKDKIKVLHDGIDTDICKPKEDVEIFLESENVTLTSKDEIITYGTRGMEPYRGFPEFMTAIEKVLKKRPNAHVIIAGSDVSCYSPQLKHETYKELMLKKLDLDTKRVHFVGTLPIEHFVSILQMSTVHVYLTYPFVLSWSILNAMSCACCVVASDTTPVREVIKDGENGFLVDFFDTKILASKIEYALENRDKMSAIRENARKTVLEKYDLKNLLPKHIDYIKSLIKNDIG